MSNNIENTDYRSPEEMLDCIENAETENRREYARLRDVLSKNANLSKSKRAEIDKKLKQIRDEHNKIKEAKRAVRRRILDNQTEKERRS